MVNLDAIRASRKFRVAIHVLLVIHVIGVIDSLVPNSLIDRQISLPFFVGSIMFLSLKGILDNRVYFSKTNTSSLSESQRLKANVFWVCCTFLVYCISIVYILLQ